VQQWHPQIYSRAQEQKLFAQDLMNAIKIIQSLGVTPH
jgi:hypothetical protein